MYHSTMVRISHTKSLLNICKLFYLTTLNISNIITYSFDVDIQIEKWSE